MPLYDVQPIIISSLSDRGLASGYPEGFKVITTGVGFQIESTVLGGEWTSTGSSDSIDDRPSAALFGKGTWQVGGVAYLSDGVDYVNSISSNTIVVELVTDLASIPSNYTTAIVKDSIRGDIFNWSATGIANGGTVFAGVTGFWVRQNVDNIKVKWFDLTSTSFLSIINNVNASGGGVIELSKGEFNLNGLDLAGLTNITIKGAGRKQTKLILLTGNLLLKSPTNVEFLDLSIQGTVDDTATYQSIYVSNFNDIRFKNCSFSGFGGLTHNKNGSVDMFLLAGDVASANIAAGSSTNALVENCEFDGNGRFTNFGIRVYTEFDVAENATLQDVLITDSHFSGYNWNAVEIAGPQTSSVNVTECTADICGLTPFDIDKAAYNCSISNIIINRMLGNIDPLVNPNTALTVVQIQGVQSTGYYAHGNTVHHVTANLLKADLDTYAGKGCAAVGVAYCKNSVISDIIVNIDGVPAKPVSSLFAFAMVRAYTISGVVVKDIMTTNATVGIVGSSEDIDVGTEFNRFENLKNIGMMTGELINYSTATGVVSRNVYKNIVMETSGLDQMYPSNNCLVSLTSTSDSPTIFISKNCDLTSTTAGINGYSCNTKIASFDNVNVNIPDQANWFKAGSNVLTAYFGTNKFAGSSVDVGVVFAHLPVACVIYSNEAIETNGSFGTLAGSAVWSAASLPTTQTSYPIDTKIGKINNTSGSNLGWVYTTSGFKPYGIINSAFTAFCSAIPVGISPSSSFADNGVVTLGTALAYAYPGIYLYYPVNSIFAGSVAGLYWTVMSTTTAGVVYNNTYTTGSPSIPSSPTPFVCTGSGAYTQSITEVTGYNFTLTGNTVGVNGRIETFVDQHNNVSAGSKTSYVRHGGTLFHAFAGTASLGVSPNKTVTINRGVANSQKTTRTNTQSEVGSTYSATIYSAANTAVNASFNVNMKLDVATDWLVIEGASVDIYPN
jgi:hypothetical protein